jgi:uncharacterized protein with GYD domain
MAKYLFQVSMTTEGVKGLIKEGASSRKATVEALIKALGGMMEAYYFAFGDADVYVIAELPDNATVAAVSMAVSASGAAHIKTTVLLTAEEADKATKMAVNYRPPGA